METEVIIEKLIESYNCEDTIKEFIELVLFFHEIFVEADNCDNTCSALELLTEASVKFELLSDNMDDKICCFFKIAPENIINSLCLYIAF